MPNEINLVLFSGLAADESIFRPQQRAFPKLIVPQWLTPNRNEDLDLYCERLAENLPKDKPLVIGGASFGGIIAMHVAQHINPRAVVLLGSIQHPSELPPIARVARPLRKLIGCIPVGLFQLACTPMKSNWARRKTPHLSGIARQFASADPAVFEWSMRQILEWSQSPQIECPVFHLHGNRDRILPVKYTTPNKTIPAAGHVISLTHPAEVNAFIRSVCDNCESH